MRAARDWRQRGNPADLAKRAQGAGRPVPLDAEARTAAGPGRGLQTELWLEHRQPGADAKAREHLARAEPLESKAGERYGAQVALHLLAEGKAAEAEQCLPDAAQSRGASNARLWLARARALPGARRPARREAGLRRAAEAAWKDPRFATAYGEALLDEGRIPPGRRGAGTGATRQPGAPPGAAVGRAGAHLPRERSPQDAEQDAAGGAGARGRS